ncbi:MAG: 4Fe-4S binding protein [Syntrophomonadaceae bacterium]
MGHLSHSKDELVYQALAARLNREPVGIKVNETMMELLRRLYTESEAMVGSQFPVVPIRIEKIETITGMSADQLAPILESMAEKGLLIDVPRRETVYYSLTPIVIGFFEYTFMRARKETDLYALAELFATYFDDQVVRDLMAGSITRLERTLVYERLIPVAVETEVLPYERASELIRQAGGGAISLCACRHKASHLGKACDAPLDVCTTLYPAAEWIIRRGLGRPATVEELLDVLDRAEKMGLVHNCDNVMNQPAFLCHCCSCCCVVMTTITKYGKFPTHPSNFIPAPELDECTGCGICADRCPLKVIDLKDDDDEGTGFPVVDAEMCLGCGVCASSCPTGAITMARRTRLYIPPRTARERNSLIIAEKVKK